MKWLADENLRSSIVRGLIRRNAALDIVRAQDVEEVAGRDDRTLLRFATEEGRVVVTHDVTTMVSARRDRLEESEACCAPIVLVPEALPVSRVVEDLLLLEECGVAEDWVSGILYLPLR